MRYGIITPIRMRIIGKSVINERLAQEKILDDFKELKSKSENL